VKEYLKKLIFVYSLVLGLLEAPAPMFAPFIATLVTGDVFAVEGDSLSPAAKVTKDVGSLLTYYRTLSSSANPKNIIDTLGEEVVKDTQSLLLDESSKDSLNSNEGRELLAYHNKFLNYFEIKSKLDKCMEDTRASWGEERVERYGRSLDQRLMKGLIEADVASFDCHRAIENKTSLDDLYKETITAAEGVKLNSLEETIYKNSFELMTTAWLSTKYKYDKSFAANNHLSIDELKEMKEGLCHQGECSDVQKSIIEKSAPDLLASFAGRESARFSSEEASADVSHKINELNDLTSTLRMDARGSWLKLGLGSTLDRYGEGTLAAIDTYQKKYLELSSTGAGSLMWTNAFQEASGAMKDVKNWDWTGSGSDIRITPHTGVTKEVMDKAISEVLGHVSGQATTVNELEKKRLEDSASLKSSRDFNENRENAIDEYVKMSPAIVGKSLAKHPDNIEAICTAIFNSIRDERNEVWWDNAVMSVTVAAGVVILVGGTAFSLTGVGTGAGIAMTSLGAGLALGALDSTYTYHRMNEERAQHNDLLNVYFSGAGDGYTLDEAKVALDNYETAVTSFNYAVGFTILDASTLGLARFGRHINPMRIQRVADFYKAVNHTSFGRNLSLIMEDFSAAKKRAYRSIIDKIVLSDTTGNVLSALNRMSKGNLEFLFDRYYGIHSLCRTELCPALDNAIQTVGSNNTRVLSRAEISDMTNVSRTSFVTPSGDAFTTRQAVVRELPPSNFKIQSYDGYFADVKDIGRVKVITQQQYDQLPDGMVLYSFIRNDPYSPNPQRLVKGQNNFDFTNNDLRFGFMASDQFERLAELQKTNSIVHTPPRGFDLPETQIITNENVRLHLITRQEAMSLPDGTVFIDKDGLEIIKGIHELPAAESGDLMSFGFRTSDIDAQRAYYSRKPSDITDAEINSFRGLHRSQLSYSDLTELSGRAIDPVETRMQNLRIVNTTSANKGINGAQMATLEDGTRAVWKPHVEKLTSNYRAEVLAYELDRLFAFNQVPQTVEHTHNGVKGSLQLFTDSSSEVVASPRSLRLQSLFDYIIDNRDRLDPGNLNYLVGADGRVISIDNGLSFTGLGPHRKTFDQRQKDIMIVLDSAEGRHVVERMKQTDLDKLFTEVSEYLGEEDARALIDRIRHIISL